ncbi:MAG: hypothetical protein BMS9Abin34_007 [Patescibacteria group bacterium]|nr:MAG: hypothetical protein BMS9Abin34_007 [Patescibacteria group bacterium]
MIWSPVLHIYQPPTQFPEITRKIAEESYAPLVAFLDSNPKAKLTLNINASLSEQLAELGYRDVLAGIRRLTERGQVELLGSGAFHPLLTRLPFSEISRQVRLNERMNRELIGPIYKPRGFFPPELAYSRKVGNVLAELGYEWVLAEDCCISNPPVRYDRVYELPSGDISVFFRQSELSLAIAFGRVENAAGFVKLAGKVLGEGDYILTAMDGETFGHHRKDSFKLLADLYAVLESATVSELTLRYPKREKTDPMESTWAVSHEDCERGTVYPRWDNPGSPLHPKQWELFRLALEVVRESVYRLGQPDGLKSFNLSSLQKRWLKARQILDRALHSDQFWWASHNPYWHPAMVERGTKLLLEAVLAVPGVSKDEEERARALYREITTEGVKMYGKEPITG